MYLYASFVLFYARTLLSISPWFHGRKDSDGEARDQPRIVIPVVSPSTIPAVSMPVEATTTTAVVVVAAA